MGLGAWQATCSSLGSFRKWRTTRQNSVPLVSPCLKSNAPGPACIQQRLAGERCVSQIHAVIVGSCTHSICAAMCRHDAHPQTASRLTMAR